MIFYQRKKYYRIFSLMLLFIAISYGAVIDIDNNVTEIAKTHKQIWARNNPEDSNNLPESIENPER